MSCMAKRVNDPITRKRALILLRQGVATQAEVARLAGVSRQAVMHWCRSEGLDALKLRADRLGREWSKAGEWAKLGKGKRAR